MYIPIEENLHDAINIEISMNVYIKTNMKLNTI